MRILFVGDDWVGSNARSLAEGFRQAGHDVIVVDSTAVTLPARLSPSWWHAKALRRRSPRQVAAVHRDIDRIATDFEPQMLFAFKAVHLDQQRLLGTPAALHVHYSPDDIANPDNITAEYLAHERYWDLIVTTKRHNVSELGTRGARQVRLVRSAYDPAWHHPCALRGTRRFLAGFIGARRPDRNDLLLTLAREHGGRFMLRGPDWWRVPALRRTGACVAGPAYGEDFSHAVATVTANLVLLNSANRDTHTCRTFEVPAAGGLFVGERSTEHGELLDEGTECLLFSSRAELREILDRCAREPDRVAKIAAAGHRRIVAGRHRYVDRARDIVDALG
ncbi:glycosyltransferase family 1 protein [Nocardia cyriacigeorgica]|uniref:Glycosyltransferase family 1 protein n=1 Tax=Nocardia cyriacigeorgica TaxID=135487 RepID=A0A5R8PAG1_9NOCA|nr:glycosyltransferase [Nocardia cyriacigeorgica]TLG05315.1 glycosyltransferase family 1 protein [Nocardia cyriacigeorgica]